MKKYFTSQEFLNLVENAEYELGNFMVEMTCLFVDNYGNNLNIQAWSKSFHETEEDYSEDEVFNNINIECYGELGQKVDDYDLTNKQDELIRGMVLARFNVEMEKLIDELNEKERWEREERDSQRFESCGYPQ